MAGSDEELLSQLQQEAGVEELLNNARRRVSSCKERPVEAAPSSPRAAELLHLLQQQRIEIQRLVAAQEAKIRMLENRQAEQFAGFENQLLSKSDRLDVDLTLGCYEVRCKQLIGARIDVQDGEIQSLKKLLDEEKKERHKLEVYIRNLASQRNQYQGLRSGSHAESVGFEDSDSGLEYVDQSQDDIDRDRGMHEQQQNETEITPLPGYMHNSNVEPTPKEPPTQKTVQGNRRRSTRVRRKPERFRTSDSEEDSDPGTCHATGPRRKRKKSKSVFSNAEEARDLGRVPLEHEEEQGNVNEENDSDFEIAEKIRDDKTTNVGLEGKSTQEWMLKVINDVASRVTSFQTLNSNTECPVSKVTGENKERYLLRKCNKKNYCEMGPGDDADEDDSSEDEEELESENLIERK